MTILGRHVLTKHERWAVVYLHHVCFGSMVITPERAVTTGQYARGAFQMKRGHLCFPGVCNN